MDGVRTVVTALALGGLAVPVRAQVLLDSAIMRHGRTSFTIQGIGARSQGIGNAFIAVADDATAVSYNPAGLAQLLQPEGSLVFNGGQREVRYRDFPAIFEDHTTSFSADVTNSLAVKPVFGSLTLPFRVRGRNAVVQVSSQRLFDMDQNSALAPPMVGPTGQPTTYFRGSMNQVGAVNVHSVATAIDLTPRLLLGAAFSLWRGNWNANLLWSNPLQGDHQSVFQRNELQGRNWTWGLMWRSEVLNWGVVYRSPFEAHYANGGRVDLDIAGQKLDATVPLRSMRLNWPETWGLGGAWRPTPRWLVALDWSRTPWTKANLYLPGEPDAPVNFFDPGTERQQVLDANSLRMGVEYVTFVGDKLLVPLRAGVFREPQPERDVVTGAQRVLRGWTLGVGVRFRQLMLDVAYRHARGSRQVNEDFRLLGGKGTPIGTEQESEKRVYVSLSFQLSKERSDKFLRWLLVEK